MAHRVPTGLFSRSFCVSRTNVIWRRERTTHPRAVRRVVLDPTDPVPEGDLLTLKRAPPVDRGYDPPMFATLLGALPMPAGPDPEDIDALVVAAVRAQEAAGLEPITDGRLRDPSFEALDALLVQPGGADAAANAVLDAWRRLAGATDRATKQALPGPFSIGHRAGGSSAERTAATLAAAANLAAVIDALAEAGCPLVEVEELELAQLAEASERALFRDAHDRVTAGAATVHRSLSFGGGSVPQAAIGTALEAPYASIAVDLIAGPDNWYVVRAVPRDRGVIAGVLSGAARDEAKEVMHWAAHYAASTGRGRVRVGVGSAGSWANLTWEVALRKLERLGEVARLVAMPASEELARSMDPRAVSSRRAAVGHGPPPAESKTGRKRVR